MRDLDESEVRQRLSELAGGVGLRPSLERPTVRRARRRRTMTAATSALVIVAVLAVSYAGVSSFLRQPPTIGNDPSPAPAPVFKGLWPETSPDALAEMQGQVDEGHHPMRVDPAGTATEFSTTLMNWPMGDVQVERASADAGRAIVVLSNRLFGDNVPPMTIDLAQLGVTGPTGVWSVTGVSTPLIELDLVPSEAGPTAPLTISGRVTDRFEGSSLAVHVLDGPTFDTVIAHARRELVEERFEIELAVPATPDGHATVVVWVPDAVGMSLGTIAIPVSTPVVAAPPTSPAPTSANAEGVPPVVAATAQRIHQAAVARDFDTLASLMDPNIFVYNLDDGSDPIPAWREDPQILDTIALVLELPPIPIDVEGVGRFYVWPYLAQADLANPTPQQVRDLERLGTSVEDVQVAGGYLGPRLAIDATGLWRNFVVGGD
ncbi:MAG: hypothetical protein ACRDHC_07290 [Actinomycetota bacterium]